MMATAHQNTLDAQQYTIRRKLLTIFGAEFHLYDPNWELIGYSKQKAFRLKEDIRVFSDETMTHERAWIRARHVVDFSAAYDVVDSETGGKIGALRRKGFASMMRDSWEFLDAEDNPIGRMIEDSMALALVRRFVANLIPQTFHASVGDRNVAEYRQHFNPFIYKLSVTISPEAREVIEPRLLLAGGILLAAIEGRQQ